MILDFKDDDNTSLQARFSEATKQTHKVLLSGGVAALLGPAALDPGSLHRIRSWYFQWYRILFIEK